MAKIPIKICPFNYLGCPLIKGRIRLRYFEDVIQKFRVRIQGWQARMLSNMGRVTMVQSVLNAVPIHLLACQNLPKGIIAKLFFDGSIYLVQ